MEIISYVGGRPDNRPKNNFIKVLSSFTSNKRHGVRRVNYNPMQFNSTSVSLSTVKNITLPKINISFKKAGFAVKKAWWLVPLAALLFAVPVTTIKTVCWFESRTNPIPLNEENEFDFLNKEMARFAMSTNAGVAEDGSIAGVTADYSFKEPVTFTNYTVKSGDTISGISLKFHLKNISTIIAVNNIENVRSLNAGKKLVIPSVDGLYYKVKSGDSIEGVAKKYDVSVEDILDVNDLESSVLAVGTNLFIPGARLDNSALRKAMGDTFINPLKSVKYRLTSRCGWRADPFTGVRQYHPGVDLAISQGTPIYAALSGKIVVAGWSNLYGNYVIIDHGNGYQTLYGHMYKMLCTRGQEVTTGTKIGLVGTTGYSTGPHLHFTVYKNGKVVDPLTLIK
ncbi:MAG: M23 family metallopeptidase [Treponema sp.]|nr:M23 family metallopeptidase [Candidatus Treponema scatequi]